MKPVHLAGRALACARGLALAPILQALQTQPAPSASHYDLREHGRFPYERIPDGNDPRQWDTRARALVQRVAADAGAEQARCGLLVIGTSCQDGEAAQTPGRIMDFHALGQRVGSWLDWQGPVLVVSGACTASLQAMLCAQEWLHNGLANQALVLGLELDNGLTVPGFAALQLLSPTSSRPFGLTRDGLVLGEAVAALRLSTTEPSAWVLRGGAHVVDGSQPTSASAPAVATLCDRACASSGVPTHAIDLIKVQAAGSPGNDAAEALGLQNAFEALPPLISLKPLLGHCMGASGVAEIALLLHCLEQGFWPHVAQAPDPALGVQLAARAPERLRYLFATILGFGGSHAAVVLEHRA